MTNSKKTKFLSNVCMKYKRTSPKIKENYTKRHLFKIRNACSDSFTNKNHETKQDIYNWKNINSCRHKIYIVYTQETNIYILTLTPKILKKNNL